MRYSSIPIVLLTLSLLLLGTCSGTVTGLWNVLFENEWHSGYDAPPEGCRLAITQNETRVTGYWAVESPQPWNGVVLGRSDGDEFDLTLTAYRQPIVMMRLSGTLTDGLIQGKFVAATSEASAWYGTFLGALMNQDPAMFEPVEKTAPTATDAQDMGTGIEDEGGESFTPRVQRTDRFYKIEYDRDNTIYPRPVL